LRALALVGVLGVSACAESASTDTLDVPTTLSQEGTGDTGQPDITGLGDLETEIEDFATAIAESDAADEVRSAWNTLAAELMTVVESAEDGTAVPRERIESELDEFAETLDGLEVEENVRAAWQNLRTQLEEAIG
jgi:hypothetical protein